ncbi:SusC/RagA family TonB-linked outer membrane protein [Pararcticibacter amylolyticus]|uniref:SusC/RagA family TonB-linked outer membrane protein n=2 Tax=Pararcticibacter amylolyticus TaxID=2173175 RepID=A0A2U2PHI8_9SPHI|nr:SusC/RagA family TonB-linked outer membrane protein [Pararcticibacter amylolyticus]
MKPGTPTGIIHKIWLIMRLTTIILIAAIMQVSASGFAQKITLSKTNASLEDVIRDLRKQSGYNFVVPGELLDKSKAVTIKVKDAALERVLDQIFENQSVSYKINNNTVTLVEKRKGYFENIVDRLLAINVSGKVVDVVSGEPLAGATVMVKGRSHGTRTNADGSFFLQNVEEGSVLVIRYTGYKTIEVPSSKDIGTIRMDIEVGNLQEVKVTVNTGYQKIKPEQSTGAVAQISTKEFESRISTNFLDGLVNRLPGLMINNSVQFTSTLPGTTGSTTRPLFNIRGISTMSANQSPLIVVDGYPTELTIDMIDPNEIESITVLKDAAAATVYGVRASNGVIVITRKQASKGKAQFTFRATSAITPKENYSRYRWADDASAIAVDYQTATQSSNITADSWDLLATATNITGGTVRRDPVFYLLAQQAAKMITPEQAASSFEALRSYDNLDDYSRLFRRSSLTNTYNLNASGGSDNALYYITGNYTGNRLSEVNNDNNRFSLSARSTLKFTKKLSLELTTDYQEQRFNSAPVPGPASLDSYQRFENPDGTPAFALGSGISPSFNSLMMAQGLADNLYYPLVELNEVTDKTRTINNRVTANFRYLIGGGLDMTFGGIYETSRSDLRHYASDRSSEARQYVNAAVSRLDDQTLKYNIPRGGFLRQEAGSTTSYTARAQLNYNKVLAEDHSINAILGAEVRNLINKGNTASYFGYNDETLLQQPVDFSAMSTGAITSAFRLGVPVNSQNYSSFFNQQYAEDRFLSGYANLVYSYKNTYSLTGSARIDQSNLFGTNPKYKYKPLWSLGAAWNVHKEEFMQDLNWLTQLKFRLAYGFNGNVAKLALPQVIAQSALNLYTSPASQSLNVYSYANNSLRWEQTKNFNAGLDYTVFKNVYGNIDYYNKKSTDLLGNSLIDPTIGVSPTLINQATINNKGIEVGVHADWISTRKVNWNTGLVAARNTSKVLQVYQKGDFSPQTLNALGYVKNHPVGAMFSYRYAGLDDEGYPLIKDTKGNVYRTNDNSATGATSTLMRSDTSGVSHYSGSSIPTINAGLSNRVDIGNFYVFCMINYYGGFKVRVPRPDPSATRPLSGAGNYWKVKGDETTTDVMGLAAYRSGNSNNAYNYADSYVVNGDYITLGDLTLSYSLDNTPFIKKAGFKHFEVKCQASNIWTVGFNKENFSMATGSYQKPYLTPTYTIGIFTNF